METKAPHLDARLAACAAYVRPGARVADVGCDHGKLAARLALEGCRVIGTDIHAAPLETARATCAAAGCADRVDLRLGDGLAPLEAGEADDIVMAGISAETILHILDAAGWVRRKGIRLILCAATKTPLLRRELCRRGFALEDETPVVAAGRVYTVLCAGYTGEEREPDGEFCLVGLSAAKPHAARLRDDTAVKLEKQLRGLRGREQQEARRLLAWLRGLELTEEGRRTMLYPADIAAYIEEKAPAALAEEWDNVGLLVDAGQPVRRVLAALDITPAVVAEAKRLDCQLVVSHHPVIFHALKRLSDQPAALLVREGLSAVCAHTNFDTAEGGVNDVLAALLGLANVRPFAGLGRVGEVPEQPAADFAARAAAALGVPVMLADAGRPVRTVAVVGGSGGDFADAAREAGADCLVTGEAAHHEGLGALQRGMSLIVGGHYATEHPAVHRLADWLRERFGELEVLESRDERPPFTPVLPR